MSLGTAVRGGRLRRPDSQRLVGGLDAFFEPGSEILVVRTTEDVLAAIAMPRRAS